MTPRQISPLSGSPLWQRLWLMLTGWGAIGVVYSLSGLRSAADALLLQPGMIDRWFRFDPDAIWIYMSFFLLVPYAYLTAPWPRTVWLMRAMLISALLAGVVFALFPTTMTFPPVPGDGLSADALRLLMQHDAVVNCLPSLHVTLTLLAVMALWDPERRLHSLLLALWGLAICLSILTLHRHQFIDLLGGLVLALLAARLALRWPNRNAGQVGHTQKDTTP